jgi:hypothetical protein
VDCVGLDWTVPSKLARQIQQGGAVQGNLDPLRMVAGGSALDEGIDEVLDTLGKGPLIFNLGHGITPQADPENVTRLMNRVTGRGKPVSEERATSQRKAARPAPRPMSALPWWLAGGTGGLVVSAGLALWLAQGAAHRCRHFMDGRVVLPATAVCLSCGCGGREPSPPTTFVVMEQRLVKVIMNPAMMVSWAAGLWLAWDGFGFMGVWLWIKIAAVVGLTAFHVFLSRSARRFASRAKHHDGAAMADGQ